MDTKMSKSTITAQQEKNIDAALIIPPNKTRSESLMNRSSGKVDGNRKEVYLNQT